MVAVLKLKIMMEVYLRLVMGIFKNIFQTASSTYLHFIVLKMKLQITIFDLPLKTFYMVFGKIIWSILFGNWGINCLTFNETLDYTFLNW